MKYYYVALKTTPNINYKIGDFHSLRELTQDIPKRNQSLSFRIKDLLINNKDIEAFDFYEIECSIKFNFISCNKIDNSVIKKLTMLL